MPRQIITLRLDGLTAGDYLAHLSDPEPPALGSGLRSVAVRAEPLGDVVEAVLEWEDCIPAPRVAALAAGLPLVAEVAALESVPGVTAAATADSNPETTQEDPMIAKKLADMADRAAAALLARPRPGVPAPLVLRWS